METEVHRRESDYEITVDGRPAGRAVFEERPGVVVFTHTEIDDAFEGHGLGSTLVRAALDDVRSRDVKVVPSCPFVKRFIQEHADYQDLLA